MMGACDGVAVRLIHPAFLRFFFLIPRPFIGP